MLLLFALAAGMLVGFVVWQTMLRKPAQSAPGPGAPRRVSAPDDDPEFLRQLGEKLRHEGDDPPRRL